MSYVLPRMVLIGAWLAAVVSALVIAQQYATATHFFGIADDLEQTVRFAAAVQITNIAVVSGQEIEKGDIILEVRQPDLDADIAVTRDRLSGLAFQEKNTGTSIDAQIVELQEQKRLRFAELDSSIRNLQAQRASADALMRNSSRRYDPVTINQEIESLRLSKRAIERATTARVDSLKEQRVIGARPIDAEIAELTERLTELEQQQRLLKVSSSLAGRIGSILFKVGDMVPPYQAMVTVHGTSPTFVKGYIHESVSNDLAKSSIVQITSNSHPEQGSYTGVVESLGARIVEFPTRLKVNPMAQAWGREVIVRLEEDHELLLGEKVSVRPHAKSSLFKTFRQKLAFIETVPTAKQSVTKPSGVKTE